MFRNPAPGEVTVLFEKRLSRQQAEEVLQVLRRVEAVSPVIARDRRSATFFGPHGQLEALISAVEQWVLHGMNIGGVAFRYNDPRRSATDFHLVFHLSPRPSTERLKEIVDQVMEVPCVQRRLWFAPPYPSDRVNLLGAETDACLFVHVYFDMESDDDMLLDAKRQVITIVRVQPFDMTLLAP